MKKEKYGLQFGCEKDKKRVNEVIGNAGEMPAEDCFGGGRRGCLVSDSLALPDVSKHGK